MDETLNLRVLTFNAWGVPLFATDRTARFEAIGRAIKDLEPDLVGLQEAWTAADRATLLQNLAGSGLNYRHYFRSGVQGSGLLVLSRYPLAEVDFRRFRLTSRPQNLLTQPELLGGKGIALARLETPLGFLDLYNLHTIAQYRPDERDIYRVHRAASVYECARFVAGHSGGQRPAIVLGDFNMRPDQLPYGLLMDLLPLTDCWASLHPSDQGATYAATNPYTGSEGGPDKRLDYMFVQDGPGQHLHPVKSEIVLKETDLPPASDFPVPRPKSFSDHYGLLTHLTLSPAEASGPSAQPGLRQDALAREALQKLLFTLEQGLAEAQGRRKGHLSSAIAATIGGFGRLRATRGSKAGLAKLGLATGAVLLRAWVALQAGQALLSLPEEIQAFQALSEEVKILLTRTQP